MIASCARFGSISKPANRASILLKEEGVFMCRWCAWWCKYVCFRWAGDTWCVVGGDPSGNKVSCQSSWLPRCGGVQGVHQHLVLKHTHTILNSEDVTFYTLVLNSFLASSYIQVFQDGWIKMINVLIYSCTAFSFCHSAVMKGSDYVLFVFAVRRCVFYQHQALRRSLAPGSCRTARWTPTTGCHGNRFVSFLQGQRGSRGIWVVQPR